MKLWLIAAFAASAASFPSLDHHYGAGVHGHLHHEKSLPLDQLQQPHDKRLPVDSMDSPIDITGKHAFHPPDFDSGDQRGPCPGLNALANHGYIPRSGVTTFTEAIAAANKVYGMGVDLALVLATLGTVWTGNPIAINAGFSIGGRDTGSNNILNNGLGLLGKPRGLTGSHNLIESDGSNTRDDLYVTGDASTMNMALFQEWYDSFDENGTFTLDMMADRAALRLEQAKATNPHFYYGPVTGFVSRSAGFIFPVRLFANHSVENPEGVLTKEVVRNFFGVYGTEHEGLTYRKGWERVPENWYKTPVDWGLVGLNIDLIAMTLKHPELASIGGNTGTVNSFAGIDLSDLTGGALNLTTLLEGNNLVCFVFQVLKFASPNILSGIFQTIAAPLELITSALKTPLLDLDCPAWQDLLEGGQPAWKGILDLLPEGLKDAPLL
ncbi:peroxidase family protein [Aspergillus stella-maris]|uniref:peroxidase family protein n=1 Tax=Aspergillus stella-maris TaxID=1810926 RepID=UPI003CCD540A